MKACKSHNVSPFAAFQAVLLTILSDKINLPEEVDFNIIADLRPRCAKSKADYIFQQIVSYATSLQCKTTIPKRKNNSDFWTYAEYCKHVVYDNLVTRIEKSLQLGSIARNIPADVLISGSDQVTSVAIFHNLGNCSFLDRRDDCPFGLLLYTVVFLSIKTLIHFFMHIVHILIISFFVVSLSPTTQEISGDIKQKIIK